MKNTGSSTICIVQHGYLTTINPLPQVKFTAEFIFKKKKVENCYVAYSRSSLNNDCNNECNNNSVLCQALSVPILTFISNIVIPVFLTSAAITNSQFPNQSLFSYS